MSGTEEGYSGLSQKGRTAERVRQMNFYRNAAPLARRFSLAVFLCLLFAPCCALADALPPVHATDLGRVVLHDLAGQKEAPPPFTQLGDDAFNSGDYKKAAALWQDAARSYPGAGLRLKALVLEESKLPPEGEVKSRISASCLSIRYDFLAPSFDGDRLVPAMIIQNNCADDIAFDDMRTGDDPAALAFRPLEISSGDVIAVMAPDGESCDGFQKAWPYGLRCRSFVLAPGGALTARIGIGKFYAFSGHTQPKKDSSAGRVKVTLEGRRLRSNLLQPNIFDDPLRDAYTPDYRESCDKATETTCVDRRRRDSLPMVHAPGRPAAEVQVGVLYHSIGDDVNAAEWWKKAVEDAGDTKAAREAMRRLGDLYAAERDIAKATALYARSFDASEGWNLNRCRDQDLRLRLELTTLDGLMLDTALGNEKAERTRLIAQAREGNARAQYDYAMHFRYEWCLGVSQPLQDGIMMWLRKSAEGGYPQAQLAVALQEASAGHDSAATDLLRKAADQGLADAQYELGLRLRDSAAAEAAAWLGKAAAQGHDGAQVELVHMYMGEWGDKKDEKEAWYWLTIRHGQSRYLGTEWETAQLEKRLPADVVSAVQDRASEWSNSAPAAAASPGGDVDVYVSRILEFSAGSGKAKLIGWIAGMNSIETVILNFNNLDDLVLAACTPELGNGVPFRGNLHISGVMTQKDYQHGDVKDLHVYDVGAVKACEVLKPEASCTMCAWGYVRDIWHGLEDNPVVRAGDPAAPPKADYARYLEQGAEIKARREFRAGPETATLKGDGVAMVNNERATVQSAQSVEVVFENLEDPLFQKCRDLLGAEVPFGKTLSIIGYGTSVVTPSTENPDVWIQSNASIHLNRVLECGFKGPDRGMTMAFASGTQLAPPPPPPPGGGDTSALPPVPVMPMMAAGMHVASMSMGGATFWLRYTKTPDSMLAEAEKLEHEGDGSMGMSEVQAWLKLMRAADGGGKTGMRLGDLELTVEGDAVAGAKAVKAAAETGASAEQQYMLALLYYHGVGISQDYKQAYFWMLNAIQGMSHPWISTFGEDGLKKIADKLTPKEIATQTKRNREGSWGGVPGLVPGAVPDPPGGMPGMENGLMMYPPPYLP